MNIKRDHNSCLMKLNKFFNPHKIIHEIKDLIFNLNFKMNDILLNYKNIIIENK